MSNQRLRRSRLSYLRLTPFEQTTAEGRTAERYRLAVWGSLANAAARGLGVLMMVLTVYWALPYLGAERFGVWATFASMVAMFSFLDLGVGNALVNRVAHAAASNDPVAFDDVVNGGIGWLFLLAMVAAGCLVVVSSLVDWGALFRLTSEAHRQEARDAAFAFSGLFGLHLLSAGALKLLVGQQRSHEAHMISAIGTLIACVALWWACEAKWSGAGLLLVTFGVRSFFALMVLPLLWVRRQLKPCAVWGGMRREGSKLLGTGSLFLALQIGVMVGWGADTLLLATVGGAGQVAAFAVAQRLFQFVSQPVAVANAPLWPAYADAVQRGDRSFLHAALRRSAWISVAGGGLIALLLLGASHWIVPLWTQDTLHVSFALLALMAFWAVVEAGGNALAMYLNGVGVVREQVVVVGLFCLTAVPLKVLAAQSFGAPGLVGATAVAYLAVHLLMYGIVYRQRIAAPLIGSASGSERPAG